MKSLTYAIALICCMSMGNVFAQGRGGAAGEGRPGGIGEIPTRSEPAASRPSSSDIERGNRPTSPSDHSTNTNGKADARKAEGTKDASQQLSDNPALATRLKGLFPANTDLGAMAGGFKNLGQFVAAAHVSHNLNIPFDQLKSKMVTGDSSLGDAIHALKPDISTSDAKAEAKKAEAQAKRDTTGKG